MSRAFPACWENQRVRWATLLILPLILSIVIWKVAEVSAFFDREAQPIVGEVEIQGNRIIDGWLAGQSDRITLRLPDQRRFELVTGDWQSSAKGEILAPDGGFPTVLLKDPEYFASRHSTRAPVGAWIRRSKYRAPTLVVLANRRVREWDLKTLKLVRKFGNVSFDHYSPQRDEYFRYQNQRIRFYDGESGRFKIASPKAFFVEKSYNTGDSPPLFLFSPSGKYLIYESFHPVTQASQGVLLADTRTGKKLRKLNNNGPYAFSADESTLFALESTGNFTSRRRHFFSCTHVASGRKLFFSRISHSADKLELSPDEKTLYLIQSQVQQIFQLKLN